MAVCTSQIIAELGYVAFWFQGDSRHAATCAAPNNTSCALIIHRSTEGQWNVWRFSRISVKECCSCRCHSAKEQYALHRTCFSLSATKTPPHTHSTFKFLGRDKLSPCVRVSPKEFEQSQHLRLRVRAMCSWDTITRSIPCLPSGPQGCKASASQHNNLLCWSMHS